MAKGTRHETTRATYWRRLILGQVGSGMTIRTRCRKHAVQEASFYSWRRERSGSETYAESARWWVHAASLTIIGSDLANSSRNCPSYL